jgi:hypothetical protein
MAVPSNTQETYQTIGNREDLINAVYMVEQTQTPFTSRIAKITATATKHEWQTEALASASDGNAKAEGDDAATDAAIPTVRLTNYTQISSKTARISGTQESVDNAGNTGRMAHQMAKKMTELKRDIEKSALANKAKAVGSSGTARVSAGIESWVATNTSEGAGATSATGDGSDARSAGTLRAFTETLLKAVLADCASAGGDPDLILVGATNKQAMSAFTGNGVVRNAEAVKQTLNTAIDIYVSDFGTLEVVYSPQSNAASALAIDTKLFALATLPGRAFKQADLAKTGDSMRKQVLTEWTLESRNEDGSGAIYDLTS